MDRRTFLGTTAAAPGLLAAAAAAQPATAQPAHPKLTAFQLACMTLPYSAFPLMRALKGIAAAGFKYVAWGTTHQEDGSRVPVIAPDAKPQTAKDLAQRCRDLGLEPVMLFAGVYPEHKDGLTVHKQRILQAAAAGIPQLLTFGHTKGDNRKLWLERFRELGPIAKDNNVLVVVKQHGGETGTGEACAAITREIDHPNIKVNYDAGNVLDYLNKDPIPDIKLCADEVRSFCIKDHRDWPRDEDCGPGFGEIDHYKLLHPVLATGRTMPLAFENIFAPLVPRPTKADEVDSLARRAREFIETVIAGLQAARP